MTPEQYQEERRDPRWQKRRLEIMERDHFRCVDCDSAKKHLNVHHQYYVKGRKPWQYPAFALLTLCYDCHEEKHKEAACRALPETNAFVEWEKEADLLFGGNPKEAFRFYDLARIIAATVSMGFDRRELFDRLYQFVKDTYGVDL